MKYIKLFEQYVAESVTTYESHFKVGDKVKMSHGGTGVVVSLDKEDGADDEAYYSIELPNGEIMKHAPNELEKINEAKIQKFIESLSASKEAKNILHNLDVFAQLNPDYSPVEAIAYIEEGLKTSGNAIKKAKKISDLLYTAGILASDVEVFGRDILSIITDGIAGKLAESVETNEGLSSQDMKALRYLQAEQDPKKIKDLQKAIGKEFSDNYSSTGKSILVDVKERDGKFVAITKEAKSQYNDRTPKKGENTASIGITWNAMFY